MMLTEIRSVLLQLWSERGIDNETGFVLKLEHAIESAEAELADARERENVLAAAFGLLAPAPLPVAHELAEVRARHGRLAGKYDKLHRDLQEAKARIERWRALRSWAAELSDA